MLSNLPPGCTDNDIERQAGALDEPKLEIGFSLWWVKPNGAEKKIDLINFRERTFRVYNTRKKEYETVYCCNATGRIIMRKA